MVLELIDLLLAKYSRLEGSLKAQTKIIYRFVITATLLCIDFSKAFDSLHRGKMVEILKAYGMEWKR